MQVNHEERPFERLKLAFWILEIFELIIALIILCITGSAAVGILQDLRLAGIPGKLNYNVGLAATTMILLLIIVPLDLKRPSFWRAWNNTWHPWPRVVLNTIFILLWIGAIDSAFYTCSDLCSQVTLRNIYLQYATLCCDCNTSTFTACIGNLGRFITVEQRTGRYEAAQIMDILLTVFFLVSTALLVAFNWIRGPQQNPDWHLEHLRNGG